MTKEAGGRGGGYKKGYVSGPGTASARAVGLCGSAVVGCKPPFRSHSLRADATFVRLILQRVPHSASCFRMHRDSNSYPMPPLHQCSPGSFSS
eukprot:363231-Chlamydomonas_euryale.AAC.3